jgi:predicted nucleic-acid-binding Zn-ribbon protein
MGGVYCPTCEAGVEVTATFCLSCGHDMSVQGPITATGHDLNQLKDVIRIRDDLSMAEKFDMIALVEDGADPIALVIAVAVDDGVETIIAGAFEQPEMKVEVAPELRQKKWGDEAADAAIVAALADSKLADLLKSGSFQGDETNFMEAMDVGRQATLHLLEVNLGASTSSNAAVADLPVMRPPKKSFCPKCGSDIQANTLLQWKKWTTTSHTLLTVQLEAAMKASLMHLASTYRDKIQDLKDQLSDAKSSEGKATPVDEEKMRKKLEKEIRKEPKDELKGDSKGKGAAVSKSSGKAKSTASKPKSKPKSGGLFGAKKPKKTYEGEPGGKAEWFLDEALDTVYDPHGTGKPIKGAQILARSSDGNVRVRDVIRAYAVEGEDGISELAWTSPLTKYLIEAYDAC